MLNKQTHSFVSNFKDKINNYSSSLPPSLDSIEDINLPPIGSKDSNPFTTRHNTLFSDLSEKEQNKNKLIEAKIQAASELEQRQEEAVRKALAKNSLTLPSLTPAKPTEPRPSNLPARRKLPPIGGKKRRRTRKHKKHKKRYTRRYKK